MNNNNTYYYINNVNGSDQQIRGHQKIKISSYYVMTDKIKIITQKNYQRLVIKLVPTYFKYYYSISKNIVLYKLLFC